MKKLIALILILVVTSIVVTRKKPPKLTLQPDGTYLSNQIVDVNWEYVKDKLFSGLGDGESPYRINKYNKKSPILIDLQGATPQDSIAVDKIIKELRLIIPNRTIDNFKNFAGISYDEVERNTVINGLSDSEFYHATIQLNFADKNNVTLFDDLIKSELSNGSVIERTNVLRRGHIGYPPNKVWFNLKETLPFAKREKYIKYEILRTFCFINPDISSSRSQNIQKGVYYTPNYIPEEAEFNGLDKFLLQKLYEEDFDEQFKDYLYTHYPWRYAINFLNKNFGKTIAWAVIICIALFVATLLLSFFQKRKFKYAYLNYFLPIYFIMLYYMNLANIYLYISDNRETSVLGYIMSGYFLPTIFALLTSLALWITDKFWTNKIGNFSFQLIVKVFSTFFIFNIPGIIIRIFKWESSGFLEAYLPTFIFTIVLSFGRGLLIYLNHYSENLVKQKDVELSRLKQVNAQAEVKLLQSQINPHFLYNALNSIAILTHKNADKTEKMALSLSDLFKYSINKKGDKMSTVADEVEMVKNYLDIEQIRFGDRLRFSIQVDKNLESTKIPMFIVQPLVENAVKHGISKIDNAGEITLKIKNSNVGLVIIVEDNGPHFPEAVVSGHGLQTVFDLLRLTYGEKASLSWKNSPIKYIKITIEKTTE